MIVVDKLYKSFKLTRKQRRDLGRNFEGKQIKAVRGVTFTCQPGRVVCLVGPNGAGKTTVLRTIATMLRPTSGQVTVEGLDTVKDARAVRRLLGFSTGATALYDRLTPRELVLYYARLNGIPKRLASERLDTYFDLLEVESFADRRIAQLSTGMKQKVSITRTLIHDPTVIVLDEATAGLDVMAARSIHLLVKQLRDEGRTILFSTHRMDEVDLLADDIAIMHLGELRRFEPYVDFKGTMQGDSLEEAFIRAVDPQAITEKGSSVQATPVDRAA